MAQLLALLPYALYGAAGAFVGYAFNKGRIELPHLVRKTEKDGSSALYLIPGFLSVTALGALVALIVDGRPQTAVAYGLSVGFLGRQIIDPLLRRFLPASPEDSPPTETPDEAQPKKD